MMFWIIILALFQPGLSCPIDSTEFSCCSRMANAGIDLTSFNKSVAHGIHSIRVEHLKYYFDASVPIDNGIPTVNTDFTGEEVLSSAPKINGDPKLMSMNMQMLDFIFSNNDEPDNFFVRGLTVVEKIAHEAHMNELWITAKIIYNNLLANPPTDKAVCSCITDEKTNGILDSLKKISGHLRRGLAVEDTKSRNGALNTLPRRKRADPTPLAPRPCSFSYSCFAYLRKKRSAEETKNEIEEGKILPRLTNAETWKTWKQMMKDSMLSEKEIYNLAMYLYCKLKNM